MIKEGIELVKRFEGFYATPYKCPGGVWTIGYGTTLYPSGRRVKENDRACTLEQAEKWLHHELDKCECVVIKYCKPYLNQKQRAALSSFVYNLGKGAFLASTLRRRINNGDFGDVPYQIKRWNKAGGKVLRGLIRRREAEAELWGSGTEQKTFVEYPNEQR